MFEKRLLLRYLQSAMQKAVLQCKVLIRQTCHLPTGQVSQEERKKSLEWQVWLCEVERWSSIVHESLRARMYVGHVGQFNWSYFWSRTPESLSSGCSIGSTSSGGEVKVSGGILPLQLTYSHALECRKLSITVEIAQRELPKIILKRPASSASWQGRQPVTWSCRRCTAPHAT